MSSLIPPEDVQPLLYSIEGAVKEVFQNNRRTLSGEDVEWVYKKLETYHKSRMQGRDPKPVDSTRKLRRELIENIEDVIALREDINADTHLIGSFGIGARTLRSLDELYAYAFRLLEASARRWRKRNGSRGYMEFMEKFV